LHRSLKIRRQDAHATMRLQGPVQIRNILMSDKPLTEAGENQSLDRVAKRLLKELPPLTQRWLGAHSGDLQLRHDTGKLLNKHLGTPDKRLARGKGVLEIVCEQLQISVSDASRFRKFAQLFRSVDDLKNRFPDVVSWTKVRDLLPKLDSNGELKSDAQAKPDN